MSTRNGIYLTVNCHPVEICKVEHASYDSVGGEEEFLMSDDQEDDGDQDDNGPDVVKIIVDLASNCEVFSIRGYVYFVGHLKKLILRNKFVGLSFYYSNFFIISATP